MKTISNRKLKNILEKHEIWVQKDCPTPLKTSFMATFSRVCSYGPFLWGSNGSQADLSGANLTGVNLSGANLSRANLAGANLHGANLSGSSLSWANLAGAVLAAANLSKANLYKANLSNANLVGADLCGANLSGANLPEAKLYEANLTGANLHGANLYGTILENKTIMTFVFGQHSAYFQGDDRIKIGCEHHFIDYWLENYTQIGKKHNYTEAQIQKYGKFIKGCAKAQKECK